MYLTMWTTMKIYKSANFRTDYSVLHQANERERERRNKVDKRKRIMERGRRGKRTEQRDYSGCPLAIQVEIC